MIGFKRSGLLMSLCLNPSKVKESESDPLLSVENGASILSDGVVTKAPVWSSNKDLEA